MRCRSTIFWALSRPYDPRVVCLTSKVMIHDSLWCAPIGLTPKASAMPGMNLQL